MKLKNKEINKQMTIEHNTFYIISNQIYVSTLRGNHHVARLEHF